MNLFVKCRAVRVRRGAAIAHVFVAIFIWATSFPATRSPNIPRSDIISFGDTNSVLAAVALARAYVFVAVLHLRLTSAIYIVFQLNHNFDTPMTLIKRISDVKVEKMDGPREDNGKSSRPVRSRRYTRRCLIAGQRPQKRLFTPEIKRYLKDWLVRRRDNPYPNREEKKQLSRETGLTYIQICNWFANWRRKLKNANAADRNQLTWGHLIRTYNDRAQGNVEQFSICSDDSIWSEPETPSQDQEAIETETRFDESSDPKLEYRYDDTDASSTSIEKYESFNNNCNEIELCKKNCDTKTISSPVLLSKWLESAARFQPSEKNYSWWADTRSRKSEQKAHLLANSLRHDRDEVEAAMALTTLASSNHSVP